MRDRYPMTVEGAIFLKKELEHLIQVERKKNSQDIATARELGDLKENAEYHAARERQSFVEGRIKELEEKLSKAQVIDITKLPKSNRVVFGTLVTLIDKKSKVKTIVRIVGEDEADMEQNKISVFSPIARGIIGKSVDDEVEIETPSGKQKYQIKKVSYIDD